MQGYLLTKDNLKGLVNELMKSYKVVAPVKKETRFDFSVVDRFEDIRMDYDTTILPPRKFLIPPFETLLKFKRSENKAEPVFDMTPTALFGLHPCDIKAIKHLDQAFSENNNYDRHYLAKREKTVIIGLECQPYDYCFCSSVGATFVKDGFDIMMVPAGDSYYVEVATARGEDLLKTIKAKPASEADARKAEAYRAEKEKKIVRKFNKVNAITVKDLMQKTWDHKLWKELEERCLACGSCNLVCPTCFCFDVQDDVSLDLNNGERKRIWDGCMLVDFAKVGSGENFREHRSQRIRHRINRKLNYLYDRFNSPTCVGCGRCVRACTVKIDPVEIVNELSN